MNRNRACLALGLSTVLLACPSKDSEKPQPTKAALNIERFSPEGLVNTTPIQVWFDQPVVDEASVGGPFAGPAPLSISPAIPGKYTWAARNQLTFAPSESFRQSTRYTVTIGQDAFGKDLGGDQKFHFHTALFSLNSVEPFYGGRNGRQVKVNLVFTHKVRPSDVSAGVEFRTASGDPVRARVRTTQNSKVIAFQLDGIPSAPDARSIEVHVDGGLSAVGGGSPIGKKIVRKVQLKGPKELKVHNMYPSERDGAFNINVRFSADVPPDDVKALLQIEPPVKVEIADSWHGVRLIGAFKPSTTYKVTIKEGLTAPNGSTLERAAVRNVMIPDFDPSVRFESAGTYLPRRGSQTFSVKTINVKKLEVIVDKVPENNLAHVVPRIRGRSVSCADGGCWDEDNYYEDEQTSYFYRRDLGSLGNRLFSGTVDVKHQKNKPVLTKVPFSDIQDRDRRGVYRIRISDTNRRWIYAEKWMLATDLGVSVKVSRTEARAQVISLKTLQPLGGAKVTFLSRTNQEIGRAWTNKAGVATQALDSEQAKDPLSLVTVQRGPDFSYLALSGTSIDTADFDIGGDGDTTAPYEAYVYADRGIYRPGDKAHLVVLVRDKTLGAPPGFPYSLEIRDPKWRVFQTYRGTTENDGAQSFRIDIPNDAFTGSYTARVISLADKSTLGRLVLKVEEFMPDRIKVDVEPQSLTVNGGDPAGFKAESAYLFGPPAKGLRVNSRCKFNEVGITAKSHRSFPLAVVGRDDDHKPINTVVDIGRDKLDDEGKATLSCVLSTTNKPRRPVRATLLATVSENGGRAVTGSGSSTMHYYDHYVGIRRNSSDRYAQSKKDADLEVLAVDRNGVTKPGITVMATAYAVEWKSILKLVNGRYRYVSQRTAKKLKDMKVKSGSGPVKLPFKPPRAGNYRVDVVTEPGAAKSTVSFWVSGSGYAAWEMNKPDQVALTLDRKDYGVGDTAKVMVRAPFSGVLYLSVERDRVVWEQVVRMKGNTTTVNLPVTAGMLPNAYVVATLLRSRRSTEKMAPMRAFGVAPLMVRSDAHALGIKLIAPKELRPNTTLDVKLRVEGARGKAKVTVAAVDEGILRITGHKSPDALRYFSRKRRLGIRTHDMFDLLLPELRGRATSIVRNSGGDAPSRKKHLTPMSVKRVKPVALWSGLIDTSADGWARARLDVPQFNGSLRLMVVAFQGDRFGAVSRGVKVRDPIVMTPTLPRFVGPLDRFEVPVEVFNGTGRDGEIEVRLDLAGKLKVKGAASQRVTVPAGAQRGVRFSIQADEVAGPAKVSLVATGNGVTTRSDTDIAIRPASTVITEGSPLVATARKPAEFKIPRGYMKGTMKTRITVSGAPVTRFGASLQYLLRYPHGCVEQTTSRVFPLLYLADLAKTSAPDLLDGVSVDEFVNAGINRLMSMKTRTGALSYWPGGEYGYPWSTTYATHFLVEAKKAGFEVDAPSLEALLDHLTRIARGTVLSEYRNRRPHLRTQAYALYVLALADRPLVSAAFHAASEYEKKKHKDPEIRALIDGALLLAGDRRRSSAFLDKALPLAAKGRQKGFWSPTRADALTLGVLAEVAPTHPSVPVLMKRLSNSAKVGRWGNTQENAYALLALGKIGRTLGSGDFWGTVWVEDEEVKKFSNKRPISVVKAGHEWAGKTLKITVTGVGTAFVSVEVEGIKSASLPAKSDGLQVKRQYFDRSGAEVDAANIKQGDLVVTKLTIEAAEGARVDNIALVDLLPAGLEIENPRLNNQSVLSWMKDRNVPDYMDIRDDRLILFTSLAGRSKRSFYYTSRAVTQGDFVLPHLHAEAMYDPTIKGYSGAGRVQVSARQ